MEVNFTEWEARLQAIAEAMHRDGVSTTERDALRAEWCAVSSEIDIHRLNEQLGPSLIELLDFHFGPKRTLN